MGKHRRKAKEATSRHKLSKSSRFEAAWDGSHATSDFDSFQNDGETRGMLKLTCKLIKDYDYISLSMFTFLKLK